MSYELGTSAHDTVEFRDGSVLSGDLVSVSGWRSGFVSQAQYKRLDRNKVKRILLIERDPVN